MTRVALCLEVLLAAAVLGMGGCSDGATGPSYVELAIEPASIIISETDVIHFQAFAIDADGEREETQAAWVSSDTSSIVIDANSGSAVALEPGEVEITAAVEDLEGHASVTVEMLNGTIVFAAQDPVSTLATELYLASGSGNAPMVITSTGTHNLNPEWSPDGREVVFFSRRYPEGIYTKEPLLSADAAFIAPGWAPQWSPGGDRLAYDCNQRICVYSASRIDTIFTLPEGSTYGIGDLGWSHDGAFLAFSTALPGTSEQRVFVTDPATRTTSQLSNDVAFSPVWSPVELKILATVVIDGSAGYSVFDAASGSRTLLIPQAGGTEVSWAPDGQSFLRVGSGNRDIVEYHIATGEHTVLLDTGAMRVRDPRWAPDQRQLLFTELMEDGRRRLHRINALGRADIVVTGALETTRITHARWRP